MAQLQVGNGGDIAVNDLSRQLQKHLIRIELQPVFFLFPASFRRPCRIVRRNPIRQGVTAVDGHDTVVNHIVRGDRRLIRIGHKPLVTGHDANKKIHEINVILPALLRGEQQLRIHFTHLPDHLPVAVVMVVPSPRRVTVPRVITGAVVGIADHIQIHPGQAGFRQISHFPFQTPLKFF